MVHGGRAHVAWPMRCSLAEDLTIDKTFTGSARCTREGASEESGAVQDDCMVCPRGPSSGGDVKGEGSLGKTAD